ncbi:outer membrane beta-barrel protein [Pedobacter sp. BS3]|uniref:TonB-dependent receptor n=1 Tax=Pedobacter sp. BS3 TaxID=2567937 RepID=UPI0011EE227F|nr:TonB-dependent receptor [Pedobacter sp. BS3]TZF82124.1 outer membrane beta-barrel protein [Pedobacter sp. BS3]
MKNIKAIIKSAGLTSHISYLKSPLLAATLFLLAALVKTESVKAQTGREVSGVVRDTAGNSVISASVKLVSAKDSLFARTNADGVFVFRNVQSSQFVITITSLGYRTINKRFLYNEGTDRLVLDPFVMQMQSNMLQTVVVSGNTPVTIKEDTVEYRASDYKLREDAVTEDLLKKLPGVDVDKDGNVTAQGKSVTKVRVNGKDFFGGDVRTATQQLPADIIDKIQIIDDYGDQANITGIKNGDPDKVLNIQIRRDKNKGTFGRANAGVGDNDRYQASLSANIFNNEQQISFLGNVNNTNISLFNFGGGSSRGGGRSSGGFSGGSSGGSRRSGGLRSFGSSSSLGNGLAQTSTGDGLTSLASVGLNYRDEWGKKLSSYGSYSYSYKDNSLLENQIQRYTSASGIDTTNSANNTRGFTTNHRFSWNLEYKPDSVNYIKFSPSFSYSGTNNNVISNSRINSYDPQSNYSNDNTSKSLVKNPNFGANLLLNHRFKKPRRNISLMLNANTNNNDENDNVLNILNLQTPVPKDSIQHQLQDITNNSFNGGANLSYSEPLGKSGNLEFNYNYNYTKYNNDRETTGLDPIGAASRIDSLSNDYDYSFTTHRIGLNYRFNERRYNYSIGLSVQPTVLSAHSVTSNGTTTYRNTGFNYIPVARFSYNFSRTRSFNVSYYGRNTEPTYIQLQPTPDFTNPNAPIYGNPDLNAEFNQTLNIRYNNFDVKAGNVLFTNLSVSTTSDKIVQNIVHSKDPNTNTLIQETHYLNADGYYTVNGFYVWSMPFQEKKYVLTFNGNANYNNNIAYSDNLKNIGHNWILMQGVRLQINPTDWLEVYPGASYTYNSNTYTDANSTDTRVSTWALNYSSKTYFLKSWLVGLDMSKSINRGYSSLSANPFIMNAYLEKQFFKGKTGALRLQGFDLFNENTNISRTVDGNITTDTQSNRLGRYFMLSFTYRFQKFNGKNGEMPPQQDPGGYRGRGMMRMPRG